MNNNTDNTSLPAHEATVAINTMAAAPAEAGVKPGDLIYEFSDTFSVEGDADSSVYMPTFRDSFVVPDGGGCAMLSLEVDDWGYISLVGPSGMHKLDMTEAEAEPGTHGGHQRWLRTKSIDLVPGMYHVEVAHRNVDIPHNKYNNSFCEYSISVRANGSPEDTEPHEPDICAACSCGSGDGDREQDPPIEPTQMPDDLCGGSATPVESSPAEPALLSAQSGAARSSRVVPVEFGFKHESIWEWRVSLREAVIAIAPPSGQPLYFLSLPGDSIAHPVGISRKRNYRVQLLGADHAPCPSLSEAVWLQLADAAGRRVCFAVESGRVVSVVSPSGKRLSQDERDAVYESRFDDAGHLTATFSATQGLMLIEPADDGAKRISWFSPDQVSQNADGSFATTGEPYKSVLYAISYADGVRTCSVTRQQRGLPAHTVTRTVDGNCVTITKGEGAEAVIRSYVTNTLPDQQQEIIESVRGAADAEPLSCSREVRRFSGGGWLTVSRTEAFNSPLARTTTYEYNEQFRLARVNRPDGGYTEYEYDAENRVTVESEPWADGGVKRTRYEYAASSDRFYDTRPSRVYTDYRPADGDEFLNLSVVEYSYESSPQAVRTTTTTYAAGVSHRHVSIDESYGEAAAYPYAAGKPKFSQAVNGVQSLHSYEPTTEHGAVHKHTTITQANDELVPGQSRMTEEFIAADDTTSFSQESIWDGSQWLLLSSVAYEYDAEQRLIRSTRGNGRVSSKVWMCCGLLRESDEDGVVTSHAYNSALQHLGTTRSAVMDGDTEITPESLSEITPDALGRAVASRREVGPMVTVEHTAYDLLGRVVKQTDALGRVTTTEYSADGLTTTVITPTGATLITRRYADGSVASVSGSGQREQHYAYDICDDRLCTTVRSAAGEILSQSFANGFGEVTDEAAPSTSGLIFTRRVFNAKGQLVRMHRDAGAGSPASAPSLYEYDAMGNQVRQVLALCDTPSKDNSPVYESAFAVESLEDGVYRVTTSTRYNAQGEPLTSTQKQLISQLSATLESKSISVDERGNTSMQWTLFGAGSERLSFAISPTSNIMASGRSVDGFTLSQTDHRGVSSTAARHYGSGITYSRTDGRGNTTISEADAAGRVFRTTDAAGHTTTTEFCADSDLPAKVTDATGHTTCYAYDARGRKVAEWGSAIQPACFAYDEADRMIALTTFRAAGETIDCDPRNRSDGDTTTWDYHDSTGLELRKTYADGSSVLKTYDAFNRLESETDARGVVKTHSYDAARGLLLRTSYSDATTPRTFAYNHLGRLTEVSDAAGTRSLAYDAYDKPLSDVLVAGGVSHSITEQRDKFGRSAGYIYAKNGATQQSVSFGYAADGSIASAGFMHGGALKSFGYRYLSDSHLLEQLTMPNNMSLTQSFDAKRDLLTGMEYKRGDVLVTQRSYSYDALGRPLTRDTQYPGKDISHCDAFEHNSRSELVRAQLDDASFSYAYDNIGNRISSQEAADVATLYEANALNQYSAVGDFAPEFDLAGNQTLVKSATGIWRISYNAENRPTRFVSEDGSIVVECAYDYMGRRASKKVTSNGAVTLHRRYIYRGYLQIAACDLSRAASPALWYILWDPTQPTATRPLAIQKDGTWYTFGWDLTKNICEVYGPSGFIRTLYSYSPYGSVTVDGDVSQPIQWSSEFYDAELGLVYYNYRYYNPVCARWTSRDRINELSGINIYDYLHNCPYSLIDEKGELVWFIFLLGGAAAALSSCTSTPPDDDTYAIYDINDTGYTLSYEPVAIDSKLGTHCGAFEMKIAWKITPLPPRKAYGVIAQVIHYSGSYYKCGSNENKFSELIENTPAFTEYWSKIGEVLPSGNEDTFSMGRRECSKGELTINADATYFEGGTVPPGYKIDVTKPSGTLPYHLGIKYPSGVASNTVHRRVRISWDCLDGQKNNTIVEVG